MSAKKIAINGRFFAQKLSGVQRYGREQVRAIDRVLQSGGSVLERGRWTLMLPPGATCDLPLEAITVQTVGRRTGHAWEQLDLPRAAKACRLLNLANAGPVLHRDKLVVVHDAAVFRMPGNYTWRYRVMHRALGRALARTGRIGTVSAFSRRELAQVLGRDGGSIVLASNGCDHFVGTAQDPGVLKTLGLEVGRYFLFVGTPAPSKNLPVLLRAFSRLERDGAKLVVAGSLARSVYGPGGAGRELPPGVIVAPGRSDAEIAALYAHAAAHVFPSLYEGFGIPPLEAMASGCRVIASDIPVLREVCADAASYFPPHDADVLADLMRRHWDDPEFAAEQRAAAPQRLARFTWSRSAQALVSALMEP